MGRGKLWSLGHRPSPGFSLRTTGADQSQRPPKASLDSSLEKKPEAYFFEYSRNADWGMVFVRLQALKKHLIQSAIPDGM